MKLGIALGGGGAKGLAHIGVLEVLEEHGIQPHYVVGTSIGSVVGALYCLHGSSRGLRDRAAEMIQSKEFKNLNVAEFYTEDESTLRRFKKELFEKFYFGRLLFKKSHIKTNVTKKLFSDLFGDTTFHDLEIKFSCNALDIQSGEEVVFTHGSLADAVWASCAIPGIFPPFIKDERIFVDGGVIDNIPVDPVKTMGATAVVAVYLGGRPQFEGIPDTGFRINQRALSFMKYHLDQRVLSLADVIINPDVAQFHWADFSPYEVLIQEGREAAAKKLKEIRLTQSFWYRLKKTLSTKS
ncbi:MAG: patatin-like phospholipase family protein [candidate division WOR-3 bacterium]|nr:MAG: patatin-like phospholipase family protein [candidate division WOR-3 bacterium]